MSRNSPENSGNDTAAAGLGTFGGVFTPSVLTILGIILFLRLGYVVGNAGLFFSAFAFTLLVIQVAAGRLSDRVGRRAVAVPAIGLLALSMALTARLNSQASLLLAAVIYGLGYGATRTSIDATIVDKVVKGARGTAMGLNYAGFDFGIGMGSFLLGLVAEMWNYQVMYASIAGLCLLVGLIFLVLS